MKTLLLLLFALAQTALASEIRLAWNASPTTGVTNYTLFAGTNSPISTTNSAARINVGTNLTATVQDLVPGQWLFAVTCQANGVESDFSNIVIVQVPVAPANMRVVVVQYSGTLTNFYDVGFFRLRLP